jgi:hypothetical protein
LVLTIAWLIYCITGSIWFVHKSRKTGDISLGYFVFILIISGIVGFLPAILEIIGNFSYSLFSLTVFEEYNEITDVKAHLSFRNILKMLKHND